MSLFDDLGGATAKKEPQTTPDPAASLLPLNEVVWGRMVEAYENGGRKGETTHIKELDPHYKWMPGYLNVWTGWMNEGKTEWIYQLLLLRAVLSAKKSAIYSPENMPEEDIYDQLIHSLTGQNPDKETPAGRRLSLARYAMARDYVREMFVVVYPGKGHGRTPQHIMEYFETAIAKHGGAESKNGIAHCLTDPWNKQDHSAINTMGGIEGYLMNTLGKLTDWTAETKQSLIVNAHPRQLPDMKQGQARPIPDSSHISGGQMWENMAHTVATYYRPWKHLGRTNELYSDVAIYVHKVKSHKRVGFPGSIGDGSEAPDVRITYDYRTGRYSFNGKAPLDCLEAEECYLSDEEYRERQDLRAGTPPPKPTASASQQPTPPVQPLRTDGGSHFETEATPPPPANDGFPENWDINGRIIK